MLGDKPIEATNLIKYLNSKNRYELEELEIEDRIETILEIKKVLTKRNLMLQLEKKCHVLENSVQRFFNKFEVLSKRDFQVCWC